MNVFVTLEKPMAWLAFVSAFLCLLWKSPVGLDWIPSFGPAWMAQFDGAEGKLAQFPRREQDEDFWNIVYLVIYGILATAAQIGGLLISSRKISKAAVVFCARLYGLFHMVIGVHHLIWSQKRDYGKLELWRYELPGAYLGTAVTALWMIYQSFQLITTNERTPLAYICQRKAIMDTMSVCTVICCLFFTVFNMVGISTSFQTERILWAITMYALPVVLVVAVASKAV